jgi:hypothetical protein
MSPIRNAIFLVVAGLLVSFQASAQSQAQIIAKALSPLPEDLRADATVYTYNETTGERITLKEGTNHVECRPTDAEGFTRCNPIYLRGRNDLTAKLRAQGLDGDALTAAVQQAEDEGRIAPRRFGSLSYRRFDTPDRIQYLFVVSLPNATPEDLGMPTGPQRDNSLAGRGTPWMMRPGTPGAHLMIPINGTELSNQPQ